MRPLLLIFSLSLALPAAAAITTAESEKASITHLLSHEVGDRLINYADSLPANQADSTRIGQARVAIYEVEAGCAAPCEDSAQILMYSGKIDFAAASLNMTPAQVKAAKDRYLPKGVPRPRAPGRRVQDPKLVEQVARRVLEAQLKLPQTVKDHEALSARSKAMAEALGRTLGPGDVGAGSIIGPALAGLAPAGATAETVRSAIDRYSARPAAQSEMYRARPSAVPAMAKDADPKLEAAIVKAQRNFADNVKMQQAIRSVLTDADKELKAGYKPNGPLFEKLFPIAGYETKLNLIASDTMKFYRGDYGGSGGGGGMSASLRFIQKTGVELNDTQLADVDHFFYASGTGTAGAAGAVACVGMSAIWDGVLPVVSYAYDVVKSASIYGYNAAKGMAAGTGNQELADRARLSRAAGTGGLVYNAKQLKTDMKGCAHGMASR